MEARDIRNFNRYLFTLTEDQIQGVYEKESIAGRDEYVALVEAEADSRHVYLYEPPAQEH